MQMTNGRGKQAGDSRQGTTGRDQDHLDETAVILDSGHSKLSK
jgi:hypothetical protein